MLRECETIAYDIDCRVTAGELTIYNSKGNQISSGRQGISGLKVGKVILTNGISFASLSHVKSDRKYGPGYGIYRSLEAQSLEDAKKEISNKGNRSGTTITQANSIEVTLGSAQFEIIST